MRPHPFFAALAALALGACSRPVGSAAAAPPAKASAAAAGDHGGHGHAEGEEHAGAQGGAHATPAGVKLCAHEVPAELCTRCNPDLVPVFKDQGDWCAEHGVPESQCRQCNPGLTFAAPSTPKDWCAEHGVPESKCTKCNPALVTKFIDAGDYCREHGFPESLCPRCHPEVVRAAGAEPPRYPPPELRVRLAASSALDGAGITTARATAGEVAHTVEVTGHLEYDRNRVAQLAARGEARVIEVLVDVGDELKRGQPAVVLESAAVGSHRAEVAAAQARVDAARAGLEREERLAARGVSPRKAVEEARRDLLAAEAERDAAGAALAAAGASSGRGGRHVLTAPFSGTVTARSAVAGRVASPDEVLVEIADLSRVWAQLDVPESEARSVRAGQRVVLTLDAARGETIDGRISRVESAVDAATRTVRARVELPNPGGALKAGMLLRAAIEVAPPRAAVLVPAGALQRAEGQDLVFVRESERTFRPVAVEVGERHGAAVAVSGVPAGTDVVLEGAFLLKTEILKDSIGAGCCDPE